MRRTVRDLSGCQETPEYRPDLRGDDSNGTGEFTVGVEDRCPDSKGVGDILSVSDGVAILADLFNSSRRSSGRT